MACIVGAAMFQCIARGQQIGERHRRAVPIPSSKDAAHRFVPFNGLLSQY